MLNGTALISVHLQFCFHRCACLDFSAQGRSLHPRRLAGNDLACSRLRDSRVRWLDKAQTQKCLFLSRTRRWNQWWCNTVCYKLHKLRPMARGSFVSQNLIKSWNNHNHGFLPQLLHFLPINFSKYQPRHRQDWDYDDSLILHWHVNR